MKRLIKWFLRPSQKPIIEHNNLYQKIEELESRVVKLEEENIETSNVLYELMNSLDAVDTRIDILTLEKWTNNNV